MKHLFFMMMMLLVGLTASAQSKREVMRERVDSVLRKNYERGSYDTLYMKRPDSKLTLKLRANLSGYYQHSKFSEMATTTTPNSTPTPVEPSALQLPTMG